MRSEPDPNDGVNTRESSDSLPPDESQEPHDYQAEMRAKISDFRGYDELAVDQYLALSHYLAMREAGMPLAQAAAMVCDQHGHDAPRGLCRRCGLGVDLTDESRKRERDRTAKRQAYLATRGN
jgi:hypothetical protein